MTKTLKTCFAVAAAATAMLIGGRMAYADPPRVEPRAPDAVREAPRDVARDARATARDVRIDRRIRRAPGELGLRLGAVAGRGLAIANLVTNSVFYNAGIRPGDYIVSVNGNRILAPGDFERYLYAAGPDQPAQIIVWRNGADQTITVQPSVLYAPDVYDSDLSYFGVEFDPQYTNQLVVLRVIPNSQAYIAGLRAGDVITNWDGRPIRSPQEFAKVIHDEKPGRVAFDYTRGGKTVQGNVNFERRAVQMPNAGPGDRTAQRQTPATGPSTVTPPANPREPIPTVRPPANPREPIPRVTPPTNPREPIPTVTPPAGREPGHATPPAGREPPRVNPPATNPEPANPRPAEPRGPAPREGTAPSGK